MLKTFNLELSTTIYEPFFNKIIDQIVRMIDYPANEDLIYTFCCLLINIPILKLSEKQILPFEFEKLFLKCDDCFLKSQVIQSMFYSKKNNIKNKNVLLTSFRFYLA